MCLGIDDVEDLVDDLVDDLQDQKMLMSARTATTICSARLRNLFSVLAA